MFPAMFRLDRRQHDKVNKLDTEVKFSDIVSIQVTDSIFRVI